MVTGNKQEAQQNYGQMPPVPFQNGASENDSNSFSNRLADPLGSRLDNLDRTDQIGVNHDLAAMDSNRNDGGLLPDDSDGQTDGGLNGRVDQMETGFQDSESGILGSMLAGSIPSAEIFNLDNRDDCEVKNGLENICGMDEPDSHGGQMDSVLAQGKISPGVVQSASIKSPASQASFDAGNATKKQVFVVAQMPQPNATKNNFQDIDFARPSGWGKLWRLVQNGNYYYYELRFINAERVRRKGGRITPQIAKRLDRRKGKGRHKASRKDADRMRSQAQHLADRLRAIP